MYVQYWKKNYFRSLFFRPLYINIKENIEQQLLQEKLQFDWPNYTYILPPGSR